MAPGLLCPRFASSDHGFDLAVEHARWNLFPLCVMALKKHLSFFLYDTPRCLEVLPPFISFHALPPMQPALTQDRTLLPEASFTMVLAPLTHALVRLPSLSRTCVLAPMHPALTQDRTLCLPDCCACQTAVHASCMMPGGEQQSVVACLAFVVTLWMAL